MAANIETVWIAAEICGILINPSYRSTDLISHHTEIAVGRFDSNKIKHNVVRAGVDEQFCRKCVILCFAA